MNVSTFMVRWRGLTTCFIARWAEHALEMHTLWPQFIYPTISTSRLGGWERRREEKEIGKEASWTVHKVLSFIFLQLGNQLHVPFFFFLIIFLCTTYFLLVKLTKYWGLRGARMWKVIKRRLKKPPRAMGLIQDLIWFLYQWSCLGFLAESR